jgi:cell division protease FtsH
MNKFKNYIKPTLKTLAAIFVVGIVLNSVGYFEKKEGKKQNIESVIKGADNHNISSVKILESERPSVEVVVKEKDGKEYSFLALTNEATPLLSEVRKSDPDIETVVERKDKDSVFLSLLFSFGPMILILGVLFYFMKNNKLGGGAGGKSGGIFGFAKSKAQLVDPKTINVSFNDVVGCDEAKEDIQEFVEYLKTPEKFSKLGGKTPRGVLLTGPAGTGKTLLAKALAKESNVPFFSLSGSEFVEMLVGVGASRVRDLFETAKKAAPCVIFIDEIDALGGKRNSGVGNGGDSEREQTLNQLLVELDGMDSNKGIILVGATNRPEILDKALLRPGRIDRQIIVALPDVFGREQILKIHSKNVPLATNVDLIKIARGTPGFSGAELSNLINEAALLAAGLNKEFVDQSDLEYAKDKIMMGAERTTMAMPEEAKRDTAFHESGHAIVAKLVPKSDPLYKVTIIPRGRALGVTIQLPEQDRWSHDINYLTDKIAILMGGRAAEEVFCNTLTNGASNDISVATDIANNMITQWGMSDLGPISFGSRNSSFLGSSGLDTSGLDQQTLREVNLKVRNLINEQYSRAKKLLQDNQDIVVAMTEALMEFETIDDWQIENLMKRRPVNDPQGIEDMKSLAKIRNDKIEATRNSFKKPKVNQ